MLWHTHCPAGGPMSSGCSGATGMRHVPGLPGFLGFPCRILQYSKIINVLLGFWCCGWSVYCTCNQRPPTLRLYTYRRASGFKLKKKKDTAESWGDLFFDSNMFNYFLSLHQRCSFTQPVFILWTNKILEEQEKVECLIMRLLSSSHLISEQIH